MFSTLLATPVNVSFVKLIDMLMSLSIPSMSSTCATLLMVTLLRVMLLKVGLNPAGPAHDASLISWKVRRATSSLSDEEVAVSMLRLFAIPPCEPFDRMARRRPLLPLVERLYA